MILIKNEEPKNEVENNVSDNVQHNESIARGVGETE